MGHKLAPVFFTDLGRMDPEEVCRRADCTYEPARGSYVVEVWAEPWEISPARRTILRLEQPGEPVSVEMGVAVLAYLLGAKDIPLSGEWVSEKDLPGGEMFFRGPHNIPANLVAQRFGSDLQAFCRASEMLKGSALGHADASYLFRVFPRVPVEVLFWAADEEFGAHAQLLFDRTISAHLPLDVIFGIGLEVCARLAGKKASEPRW